MSTFSFLDRFYLRRYPSDHVVNLAPFLLSLLFLPAARSTKRGPKTPTYVISKAPVNEQPRGPCVRYLRPHTLGHDAMYQYKYSPVFVRISTFDRSSTHVSLVITAGTSMLSFVERFTVGYPVSCRQWLLQCVYARRSVAADAFSTSKHFKVLSRSSDGGVLCSCILRCFLVGLLL